jgi:hypothetical protein
MDSPRSPIEDALPRTASPIHSSCVLSADDSSAARRLNELRRAQPGDPTLQNLLGILSTKLELCSRLPVFEYEAASQGHDQCVRAFRRLAEVERQSFNEVLACLRRHIDESPAAVAEGKL